MIDYLVTGGNGFIGKNLTDRLSKDGKSYKVIDLNVDNPTLDNGIILDTSLHLPSIECDTAVHLASETDVRKSIKEPLVTIKRNSRSILNCLELTRAKVFNRLVFTSSANSDSCLSPYLASKRSCEDWCIAYRESYGINVRILKLSNVYGPSSIHKHSVIPTFIRNCIDRKPLVIIGSGNQKRDFIYVDDVVDSIIGGAEGFIASGELTSIRTLAYMISDISKELMNYEPSVEFTPAVKGEVQTAVNRTDIYPSVSIEEGLRKTFEWFGRSYGLK